MASHVFYRKWRPQVLAEVVGQEHVTRTLLNALKSDRVSHAYLFCGPRGTGKTSTGRILAKAVNCLTSGKGEPCNECDMCRAVTEDRALDVIEIDAASNTSVDHIRELREKVNYAPNEARYKVYIIDEVHMLSNSASNALLKTLEEPPPHVIFVLATTETHKVLPTIISRCQRFDFRRISQKDVVARLTSICQAEGIQIEPQGLQLIARSTTGSLRDAENLLERLTTCYGANIEFHQVQAILGITGDWRAKELVKHIANSDIPAGIATINSINNDGLDLSQFNRELVGYLRDLLLIKTGSSEAVDLTDEDKNELKALAARASLSQIAKAVKLFGALDFSMDSYSTLPLELALVDCALSTEGAKEAVVPKAEPESRPVSSKVSEPVKHKIQTEIPVKPKAAQPEPVEARPRPVDEAALAKSTLKAIPVAPAELSSEIERLKFNWKLVIAEAPPDVQKTNAMALLRSGSRPIAVEGDVVVLSFKHTIHKDNMEKNDNRQAAEKVISKFLGRPCRIRCVCEPESDHLVKAALKMGAQITSVEEK